MDQAGIIRDLLSWLEGHLDQPLSLDNVAAKAGYSKWHLQRMFKDVTGHAIGAIFARAGCRNQLSHYALPPVQSLILRCSTVSTPSRPSPVRSRSNSR